MTERTNIPSSPACGQWETLLADALDGLLPPEDEAVFAAHMAGCANCTTLFEEARRGREWLEFLSPEPEVPAGLLDKLLAQTGPGQVAGYGLATPAGQVIPVVPAWQRPGFMAHIRRFAEPRLLMTAAMAFFSIALTLNLTGIRISRLRLSDLKPTSVRSFVERQFTTASTPLIRYYDHLRFVYEVQSRMRELRRTTQSEDNNPGGQQQKPAGTSQQNPTRKDGGSRVEPPQQSGNPTFTDSLDYLETSLSHDLIPHEFTLHDLDRPAHSGGSVLRQNPGDSLSEAQNQSRHHLGGDGVGHHPSELACFALVPGGRSTQWTA